MHRLAIALLLIVGAGTAQAAGIRCDGGLVDRGDLQIEVLDACGEPDFRDDWAAGTLPAGVVVPDVTQWTYNFGRGNLLYVLRFRNGRVIGIDSDGYGFDADRVNADCGPTEIVPGMTKYRLLSACGSPAQRDSRVILRSSRHFRYGVAEQIRRETWIYNFGSRRLLREVILENGRVVRIDTDNRGFD